MTSAERVAGYAVRCRTQDQQSAWAAGSGEYRVLDASKALALPRSVDLDGLSDAHVQPHIVLRWSATSSDGAASLAGVLADASAVGCGLLVTVDDGATVVGYALGPTWSEPATIPDLSLVGCLFERNGVQVATAAGANAMGHPAASAAALLDRLAAQQQTAASGALIFTGALTEPFAFGDGCSFTATFGRLGSITLTSRK